MKEKVNKKKLVKHTEAEQRGDKPDFLLPVMLHSNLNVGASPEY
jgi:hypothetical protein